MLASTAELLNRYRQDSGFPQNASSMTNGFGGGVSVYTNPLITVGEFTANNPNVIQNQNPAPRQTEVGVKASVTTYPTFNSTAFIIFGIIVAAIWYLGRG